MTTSIFWLIVCILYLIYCNYYHIYPITFFLHIFPSLFCHGTAFISYSLLAHLYYLAVFFSLPSANMALLSFSLFLQIGSFQAQRIFNSSHPSAHCFRHSIFLLYSKHRIYSSRYKRFLYTFVLLWDLQRSFMVWALGHDELIIHIPTSCMNLQSSTINPSSSMIFTDYTSHFFWLAYSLISSLYPPTWSV